MENGINQSATSVAYTSAIFLVRQASCKATDSSAMIPSHVELGILIATRGIAVCKQTSVRQSRESSSLKAYLTRTTSGVEGEEARQFHSEPHRVVRALLKGSASENVGGSMTFLRCGHDLEGASELVVAGWNSARQQIQV